MGELKKFLLVLNLSLSILSSAEVFLEAQSLHFQSTTWKVKALLMDVHEVSQNQYRKLSKELGLSPSSFENLSGFSDPNQPVVGVDFFDASQYCAAQGKRLPTYLEFVRASQGEVPREYPFGNEFPAFKMAPFLTHSQKPMFPVSVESYAQFRTPEGIYHLAGNVSEWTSDRTTSTVRVVGGSYISGVRSIRVGAYENVDPTENMRRDLGFRCARDAVKGLELAGIQHLDPDALKSRFYTQKMDRDKALKQDTHQKIKAIQTRTLRQEELELQIKLRTQSLHELKRREDLVSQEISLPQTEMTGIPPGYFLMGDDGLKGSGPRHLVYLDRYDLNKTLVTVGEVLKTQNTGSLSKLSRLVLERIPEWKPALLTFKEARSFCKEQEMDLPTEAQWEKAMVGLDREERPGSLPGPTLKGYFQVEIPKSTLEWTRDALTPYPADPSTERRNPHFNRGFLRAVRGQGSHPESLSEPSQRKATLDFSKHGFRCVRELEVKPNFPINREWNYFFPEFYIEIKKRIQAFENVFEIEVENTEFRR